jgi:hypothetical protein
MKASSRRRSLLRGTFGSCFRRRTAVHNAPPIDRLRVRLLLQHFRREIFGCPAERRRRRVVSNERFHEPEIGRQTRRSGGAPAREEFPRQTGVHAAQKTGT